MSTKEMKSKSTLSPALVEAQKRYRANKKKLPGTLIPEDVLEKLEKVQSEIGTDKLSQAIWHVVREYESN